MRLFVAIEAPESWQRAAADVQRRLAEALPPAPQRALRPVDPALMHLTLRFLGEVDERRAEALQAALDGHVEPFVLDLSLAAAGSFGPASRTSVAWLGVGGDVEGLRRVAAQVERAVRAAGMPPEGRDWSPHLTLVRVHRSATAADRRAIADAVRSLAPAPEQISAHEALLVRSHLGGRAPRYEVLSRHG